MQEATNLLIVDVDGCCHHLFEARFDSLFILDFVLQVVLVKSTVVEVLRIMKEVS